jgi:hypothetical protein
VTEPTRAEREEKVIEVVRGMLPDLGAAGGRIVITELDPATTPNGETFRVEKQRAHICRR